MNDRLIEVATKAETQLKPPEVKDNHSLKVEKN